MEKRTILFIIISVGFIFFWDYFVIRKHTEQAAFKNATGISAQAVKKETTHQPQQTLSVQHLPIQQTLKSFDSKKFQFVISQENGFLKKLLLKNYYKNNLKKEYVDLFYNGLYDVYDSIYLNDKGSRIVYNKMNVTENDREYVFDFVANMDFLDINKRLIIEKDNFKGKVSFNIVPKEIISQKISIATAVVQSSSTFDSYEEGHPLPLFLHEKKNLEHPSEKQLKKGYRVQNVKLGGLSEKYFALLFIDPKEQMYADATYLNGRIETILTFFESPSIASPVNIESDLFFGPKDPKILKGLNNDLEKIVDYGFFHFISKPLLMILNFFYSFTKNYGVSIILLTILIKLVFYPLSQKSYRSMKELQKLQPKLEEIRKKYADNKEALNREMMLLYKRHGVNPMSGCLPMLVQIPFFIALYQALMNSIELRQAPFMLWIQDLSAKDPYYVTPILMGATMLLQQMLTPSSGDPMQKRMMYILPVVFTFMFINFPSGLVVYWLVNNVFSIVQQLVTMKKKDV